MSINSQNTFLNIEDAHLRLRTGNVYAQGITIGGITVDPSHGLQRVSDTGNVTATTLQFDNATTAFTTTANVTVGRDLTVTGNTLVSSNLTVTGNAVISDNLTVTENLLVSNNLTVTGNTFYTNPAAVLVDSNVVAEYTGPHDRPLRKYPEVALTTNSSGGYVASASSSLTSTPAYLAFDGSTGTTWHTQYPYYTENGGVYDPGNAPGATGTHSGTLPSHELVSGYAGEYITLGLPNKIKMSKISINTRVDASLNLDQTQSAEVIVVVGSHDGSTWEFVDTHTVGKYPDDNTIPYTFNVNTSTYYEHVGLICTNTGPTDSIYNTAWSISKLAFYGHEEGSGSIDTTLKSVYNVPATTGTQLEVYYDGQDFSSLPATVTDKAGTATNATISNSGGTITFDSTYKAWVFGGDTTRTDTFISAALPSSFVDDQSHSVSLWFNPSYVPPVTSSFGAIFSIALATGEANSQNIQIQLNGSDTFSYVFWNNDEGFDVPIGKSIVKDQWYHLSATYEPSTGTRNIFLNGEKCVSNGVGGANPGADLDIQSGSVIKLGARINGTQEYFGSIANFRLYSKALNAGQVHELYDYQKDYFLGSKSQVTLYKGHLGVGVTEPSGQLELAGDERIQEYPPRGLVGDNLVFSPAGNAFDYNVEGHGVFKLLSSYNYHAGTSQDRRIYKLFDKSDSTITHWSSFNGSDPYEATTGAQITTLDGGGTITAHIAEIQMPYKITLKKYILTSSSQVPRALKTGMIVGSNDGNVFHVLHNVPDFGFTATSQPKEYTVDNTTTPYRIFRLLLMNTNGNSTCNMNEWRLFGTPGPTTLDKGSLTLGRSLDVPRISRYDVDTETPRPEKLVVDFDTTVNESPTDISGQGNHGTFVNGAYYHAADKAFLFDGTDDYIKSTISPSITGEFIHSYSIWLNFTALEGSYDYPIIIGSVGALDQSSILRQNSSGQIGPSFGAGYNLFTSLIPDTNRWYHMVVVYRGGAVNTTNVDYYIDGVKQTLTGGSTGTLAIDENTLSLGATSTGGEPFKGKISNFKLYNVALEASEVQKLYRLGRTGRSMVISDTAVGIGKVPEAQLDVRGNLNVDGVIKSNSPVFSAYEYDGYTATAVGYVTLGNTFVNKGGCYDTSNGTFTAPISGTYRFTVDATLRSPGATGSSGVTGITTITLYINNVNWNPTSTSRPLIYQVIDPGTHHQNVCGSLVWNLTTGDTVRIYMPNLTSGTDINWGHGYGRFMGYLIS